MTSKNIVILIMLLIMTGCEKNREPKACFTFPYSEAVTNTIVAPANCSENASEYLWDDGNGNQYTESEPHFIYPDPGKYCVTLTAYSKDGGEEDIITDSLLVNVPSGKATFWQNGSIQYSPQVKVKIGDQTETITNYYPNGIVACDMRGCANFTLPVGTHTVYAWSGTTEWGPFTIDVALSKCHKWKIE